MLGEKHRQLVRALEKHGPIPAALLREDESVAEAFETIDDLRRALAQLVAYGYVEELAFEYRGGRWVYSYAAVEERVLEAHRPPSAHPLMF